MTKASFKLILAALAAASALLLAFSCTKQDTVQSVSEAKVFTASIEQLQTKTVLVDEVKVNWSKGDLINVNGAVYSATPTGNGTAEFTLVNGEEPQGHEYCAIYPESLYDGKGLHFPQKQEYEPGRLNAPMFAYSSGTEKLTFKNMCGVVCFALTGSVTIAAIELQADDKALCGAFEVNHETAKATIVDGAYDGNNNVVLICGKEGVKLSSEEPTYFYIYLPETTFEAGSLHASIVGAGNSGSKDLTSKVEVTVEANNIYTFEYTIDSFDSGEEKESVLISDTPEKGGLKLNSDKDALYTTSDKDGSYYAVKCKNLGEVWYAQLKYDGLKLECGATYKLKVKAKVAGEKYAMYAFLQVPDVYKNCGDLGTMTLTPEWQNFELMAKCTLDGGEELIFNIGDYDGEIHIASVTLEKIQEEPQSEEKLIAQFGSENIAYWTDGIVQGEYTTEEGVYCLKLTTPRKMDNTWDNQFSCEIGHSLEKGKTYKVKVKIKTSEPFSIPCEIQYPDENVWPSFPVSPNLETSTQWQDLTCTGTCDIDNASRINFSIGDFVGDFYVAQVSIYELTDAS